MRRRHRANRGGAISKAHILQSLLTACFIFIVLFVNNFIQNEVAATSLAASTFIAFSFPHDKPSQPRYLLGGCFVGAACGLFCGALLTLYPAGFALPGYIPACAIAVMLAMIAMTLLNVEHPPAAGLAAAVAMAPNPVDVALAGIACIVALVLLKEVLKERLRNL